MTGERCAALLCVSNATAELLWLLHGEKQAAGRQAELREGRTDTEEPPHPLWERLTPDMAAVRRDGGAEGMRAVALRL